MVEKSSTVSVKLFSLQHIFCVKDTKYKQKSKVQELPASGTKVLDIRSPELKWVQFWWPSIARELKNTKGA